MSSAASRYRRVCCSVHGAVLTETVSIRPHSSTVFVHAATRGFQTNGIIVLGVMVLDLNLILLIEKSGFDTTPNAGTVKESLCVSCVIAPGADAKSGSSGSPDLFLKFAVGAAGL